MSGLFGVVAEKNCPEILFYGTDYHSHLGAKRAGLAVLNNKIERSIHNISTSQFKSKFIDELPQLKGGAGIGVISDSEPQPIIISSSFGTFGLVFNGLLANKDKLAKDLMRKGKSFSEMSNGQINSVEVAGKMIASQKNILAGINHFFDKMTGSASMLVLAREGVYAIRDKLGRTPLVVAKNARQLAVASENSAFANLGFESIKELLPGEVVLLTKKGVKTKIAGKENEKICALLWIYNGFPTSSYDGQSVELVRERSGKNLAKNDQVEADLVSGVPDSGIAHALGYARASGIPYRRPLVKYTPGYGRSYTPLRQATRDQIAKMKLIANKEVIKGKRIIICDDSIVRGTQLKNQGVKKLWQAGAKEIHGRIACPPLMFPCQYCLATRTRKELITRRVLAQLVGKKVGDDQAKKYSDDKSKEHQKMVSLIGKELGLTSLKYQTVDDMVAAIGLPRERLCLECWLGRGGQK